MALNASKVPSNGNVREPLEPGGYPGRLVQVVDLGLQPQNAFQGKEKPPARMIMLTYELADEFMKDEDGEDIKDKPRWISERMPLHHLNAERAKSTQRYKVLDPQNRFGGDFTQTINTPVLINIINNPSKKDPTRVYENVAGIAPLRKKDAEKLPPLVNEPVVFDLDEPDMESWEKLPEFIQNIVKDNLEYKGSELHKMLGDTSPTPAKETKETRDDVDDDELPF